MSECQAKFKTKRIWVFNKSDAVWDERGLVRLKRKYGKFKRVVYEFKPKEG